MTTEFTGFTPQTIDFMWNLRFNNNKPWFEAHKDEFICDLQTPMKALEWEILCTRDRWIRRQGLHPQGFTYL